MLCPPPFTHDSAPEPDLMAWRGGVRRPPTWQRYAMPDALDAAGFHCLVRMAQLPREELLHMARAPFLLSPSLMWVWREDAASLLGRIALDALLDDLPDVWQARPAQHDHAMRLGLDVINAWFPR